MLLGMQLYRQLLKEARRLPHPRTRCVGRTNPLGPRKGCPLISAVLRSEHYTDRIRSEFRREHLAPESSRQAVRRVQRAQKVRLRPATGRANPRLIPGTALSASSYSFCASCKLPTTATYTLCDVPSRPPTG